MRPLESTGVASFSRGQDVPRSGAARFDSGALFIYLDPLTATAQAAVLTAVVAMTVGAAVAALRTRRAKAVDDDAGDIGSDDDAAAGASHAATSCGAKASGHNRPTVSVGGGGGGKISGLIKTMPRDERSSDAQPDTRLADVTLALQRSSLLVVVCTCVMIVVSLFYGDAAGGYLDVHAALSVVRRYAPPPDRASLGDVHRDGSSRCASGDGAGPLLGAYGTAGGVPSWVPIDGIAPDVGVRYGQTAMSTRVLYPRAAALFRQGLLLRYGFNADEARRNFLAAAASGDCAVCMWGVAASLMPDINNWRTTAATRAAGRAAALSAARVAAHKGGALTVKERGLIRAVGAFFDLDEGGGGGGRYATGRLSDAAAGARQHEERGEDGESAQLAAHVRYLAAMEAVAKEVCGDGGEGAGEGGGEKGASAGGGLWQRPEPQQYRSPDDPDVLALLAEAHMNLTPWWGKVVESQPDGVHAYGKWHPPLYLRPRFI